MATAEPFNLEDPSPDRFALIIGAMKSGTTTLFELLDQHPQIAGSTMKEPGFFSDPSTYKNGFDWYRGLWRWDPSVHEIALEASPAYTTFPSRPGVAERIAALDEVDFRFIYVLRNPIDQIQSTVRHTLYAGWGKSLDEGIPTWMIENASYATQLDQYLEFFPEEKFLIFPLEEFAQQPLELLRRTCEFLGVDPDFPFTNVDERYNTGDVYELARPWTWITKFTPARWLARRFLPRGMRHRVRSAFRRLPGRNTSLGRYELTTEERALVIERLSDDLRRLQERYGVPTQRYWSINEGKLTT